jgi:hypothetical protein
MDDMRTQNPPPNGSDRDDEIREAMAQLGLDESEAAFVVAMRHGEVEGDVLTEGLSAEERARLGIDSRVPPLPTPVRS